MSQKLNHDAKNIGARFRSARSLVPNLNRKSFCERYGINRYTMQSWENGLHVSKGKNVEKFIEALAREGVFCTSEWLIDGSGESARSIYASVGGTPKSAITEAALIAPDQQFTAMLEGLEKAHRAIDENLVITTMSDDAMAPKFMRGDTVMGRPVAFVCDQVHQKYCIIELNPERKIVRKILVFKDNLLLVALDDRVASMTLSHKTNIYEIVWHLLKQ